MIDTPEHYAARCKIDLISFLAVIYRANAHVYLDAAFTSLKLRVGPDPPIAETPVAPLFANRH
jgi:hypothetical protein